MIFFIAFIILGAFGLHAILMSAVNNYDYYSSPQNEWVRFETEKFGGRYYNGK